MSLYRRGLGAKSTWFPSALEPRRNQVGEIIAGLEIAHRGGRRMFEVGALEKQEPVAPTIPGMVGWAKDVGAGLFLCLGTFLVVGALRDRNVK